MDKNKEMLREEQAVLIANMVYGYQGSDKNVIEKQIGKEHAGKTLEDIVHSETLRVLESLKMDKRDLGIIHKLLLDEGIDIGYNQAVTEVNENIQKAVDSLGNDYDSK